MTACLIIWNKLYLQNTCTDSTFKSNIFMEFETTMARNGCPEYKPQP